MSQQLPSSLMQTPSYYNYPHDDDNNSDTGSTASNSGIGVSTSVPLITSSSPMTDISVSLSPQQLQQHHHLQQQQLLQSVVQPQLQQQQQQLLQSVLQSTDDSASEPPQKRKKVNVRKSTSGDKAGKGLRHFSLKVCEKVQKKGQTTYNEVAEELVQEFTGTNSQPGTSAGDEQAHDQKNIRRRVYDALNVLMAMNIISKDKKEIRWKGLPLNFQQEYESLNSQRRKFVEQIEKKKQALLEVDQQRQALKNLCERNTQSSFVSLDENARIGLPFIIVNTNRQTMIECEMNPEGTEIFFEFSAPFELHDDNEILKRMGMHESPTPLADSAERSSSPPFLPSPSTMLSSSQPPVTPLPNPQTHPNSHPNPTDSNSR